MDGAINSIVDLVEADMPAAAACIRGSGRVHWHLCWELLALVQARVSRADVAFVMGRLRLLLARSLP